MECAHVSTGGLGFNTGNGYYPASICNRCGAVRWYRVDWGFSPWIPARHIMNGLPDGVECNLPERDRTTWGGHGTEAGR